MQTGMRDHISVEISQPDEDLVASIREKIENISYLHCICRVKNNLKATKDKAYSPDKVSIGPYHHKDGDLKAKEDKKWHYMHTLLNRKPNLEGSLDDCVTALKEVEHRARKCYADHIDFTSNEFLEMMLVDGCFIIELLLKYSIKSLRQRNDPIFTTPGMLYDLWCDLILLENQIPLFILQRLFQVVPIPNQCTYPFPELAFRFFKNMIPGNLRSNREKFNQEAHHLLDIICHCLLPTNPRVLPKLKSNSKTAMQRLLSATELQDKGIRIKKARTGSLLDINFENGVLEIPQVVVHQYTEILFRNLIALEECSCGSMQYITSYAIFMKSLIRGDKDVKLLHQRDILTNYDATEKEEDTLFDELSKEVSVKEFYYDGLCEQVNRYKGRIWHKKLRHRKRRNNPELHLILYIAVFVLLLTLVGTLFSVLSFSLHRF